MKKIIMAAVILAGLGTAGMAQTTAKTNTKPVPKMTVAKKTTTTHVAQSVTPTPKPVSTTNKTTRPIGKKAKARKHHRKANKAVVKSNKAATHHAKKIQKKQ